MFEQTNFFLENKQINEIIKKNLKIFLIPLSYKHPNFNFAFWDNSISRLYVFQVNVKDHSPSHKIFFKDINDFGLQREDIQFIWIGFNEDYKNEKFWNNREICNSLFLNYKQINVPKRKNNKNNN